jgi:hypothetical protein
MSSDFLTTSVLYWGIVAASDFGSAYAGYLALSVWRGLSVPIYRSRALWTGILAFFFVLGFPVSGNVGNLLPLNYTFVAVILAYFILYPAFVIAFFAWVDRTITMLIRLDYLRRDLVWWSKLRWAFRVLAGVTVARAWLSTYGSPYIFAITPGSAISIRQQFFSDVYLNILFLVPLTYGSMALLVGSRRTPDTTFRLHAKWLGYTAGATVLSFLAFGLTADPILGAVPFLLISYSFYKVARFLVPVGKLSSSNAESSMSKPGARGPEASTPP